MIALEIILIIVDLSHQIGVEKIYIYIYTIKFKCRTHLIYFAFTGASRSFLVGP